MSKELLITIITLAVVVVFDVVAIIVALIRGDIKKFVQEKMAEAEELFKDLPKPEKSVKKFEYVVEAVKTKYKFLEIFVNVKKLIEELIKFFNSMNGK